jgi:hypothetical protein
MELAMDWFNSKYSDQDLAEILSDYHKSVHGFRLRMNGTDRCSLVRELEALDSTVAARKADPNTRAQMIEDGWDF